MKLPSIFFTALALLAALAVNGAAPAAAQHDHHQHAAPAPPPAGGVGAQPVYLEIPDVPVLDQDGRELRFYSDLVQGKTVLMNFVFTTCTTICPPMGANFGQVQKLLGDRGGRDIHLISVSVDPGVDTPERLKAWGAKFGAGPGWTLVTGQRTEITRLLKSLGVYTPDIDDHSPLVLLGSDPEDRWTRAYGLAPPAKMVELVEGFAAAPPEESAAHRYFGDVVLTNQDGEPMRLYSDLLQGKIVVIDVMFTACTGACPIMSRTFAALQEHVGDRLGNDVHLISISVDPVNDTPAKLKEYAARFGARPGWYFLTGPQENVEAALKKLGQYVADPEAHQNLFLLGNEPTGLWKKAFGLARPEEIVPILDSVMNDPGGRG